MMAYDTLINLGRGIGLTVALVIVIGRFAYRRLRRRQDD